ncbi:MAG: Flp pilus assembly complex ATPase component TadA [Phycisphaerales bacterium]|nr:Flp pilus assembly complex ATPase component TadA [Phycisphaerales bacterium]
MTERLFSTYQIAKLLGTTLGAVTKWMDDGSLNFCRMPDGAAQITESDLINFLTQQGIDLGQVLVKAGYTEVVTTEQTDKAPQEPAPSEPDQTDDHKPEMPDTTPVETSDTEVASTEQIDKAPQEPAPIEPDQADDQEPETPETPEITPIETSDTEAEPIAQIDKAPQESAPIEPDQADDQEPETPDIPKTPETPEPERNDRLLPTAQQINKTPPPQDDAPEPQPLQATQICDAILADAAEQNAQTIHLTPREDQLILQLRIDGRLREKPNFDRNLSQDVKQEIIACLLGRTESDIDSANISVPLSAEFTHRLDGRDLMLGVSAIPTLHGVRLVIHMPPRPANIAQLNLDSAAQTRLEQLLQGDGLIIVASKRRTGRDTALRAMLNSADTDHRSVIAIEQNAAPNLDNAAQIQIDPSGRLTYAAAMSQIDNQDADTILLTELRDPTTGLKAFQAAHDGSLVIAGINADSAAEAVSELLAMGIEPWPLGGTLKAVIEQNFTQAPNGQDDQGDIDTDIKKTLSTNVIFAADDLKATIRNGIA